MSDHKTEQFAIVELLGHAKIAGRISEQTFGGAALVRVDVLGVLYVDRPYDRSQPKHTVTIPGHPAASAEPQSAPATGVMKRPQSLQHNRSSTALSSRMHWKAPCAR